MMVEWNLQIKLLILLLITGHDGLFSHFPKKPQHDSENNAPLEISYIGNMGVLLENHDKTVLIDGFHTKYKPAYVYPTEEMVEALISGTYPGFTQIEMSLATHIHKDHFSSEISAHFLRKNKNAVVVGSNQIREELVHPKKDLIPFVHRVKAIESDYKVHSIEHKGIRIEAIQCDHTYPTRHSEIQNVAYVIDLNGYRVLHIGDTQWSSTAQAFEKLTSNTSQIDVAILPSWMLLEKTSKNKIKELINPKMVIATHIDPHAALETVEAIHQNFDEVVCFTELKKTIEFNKKR